jgi:hypothetical protein
MKAMTKSLAERSNEKRWPASTEAKAAVAATTARKMSSVSVACSVHQRVAAAVARNPSPPPTTVPKARSKLTWLVCGAGSRSRQAASGWRRYRAAAGRVLAWAGASELARQGVRRASAFAFSTVILPCPGAAS